jgi:hypothetical protein
LFLLQTKISMLKYTANNLKKIEDIFTRHGYIVRYEKGNFNPGYCILENKKVIVINRYFSNESKINCLLDIFNQIDINLQELDKDERQLIEQFESKLTR